VRSDQNGSRTGRQSPAFTGPPVGVAGFEPTAPRSQTICGIVSQSMRPWPRGLRHLTGPVSGPDSIRPRRFREIWVGGERSTTGGRPRPRLLPASTTHGPGRDRRRTDLDAMDPALTQRSGNGPAVSGLEQSPVAPGQIAGLLTRPQHVGDSRELRRAHPVDRRGPQRRPEWNRRRNWPMNMPRAPQRNCSRPATRPPILRACIAGGSTMRAPHD